MPWLNVIPFQCPAVTLFSLFGFFLILQATPGKATYMESHGEKFSGHTASCASSILQTGKVGRCPASWHAGGLQDQALRDSQGAQPPCVTVASADRAAVPRAWNPTVWMV